MQIILFDNILSYQYDEFLLRFMKFTTTEELFI